MVELEVPFSRLQIRNARFVGALGQKPWTRDQVLVRTVVLAGCESQEEEQMLLTLAWLVVEVLALQRSTCCHTDLQCIVVVELPVEAWQPDSERRRDTCLGIPVGAVGRASAPPVLELQLAGRNTGAL
jgi:hypothetical protein